MKASILITTFNRPSLLSFGLESLSYQNFNKDDVEVIVLNDGNPDDGTVGVCELFEDELNIKHFAAAHRSGWRIPGFAINYGARKSIGDVLFISCAEIYHIGETVQLMLDVLENHKKILTIPANGGDDNGTFLEKLKKGEVPSNGDFYSLERLHNIHLPFFIGMHKQEFMNIGGYDEEFTGIGYDDNDIVHRLTMAGNKHVKVDSKIVHLYHPRLAFGNPVIKQKFQYNQRLFYQRRKNIIRNVGVNWGTSF